MASFNAGKTYVSAYKPFDPDHVKSNYSKADDGVVSRLGLSITRRQYCRYWERYRVNLSKGIDAHQDQTDKKTSSVPSETIATDFKTWNTNVSDRISDSGTQIS